MKSIWEMALILVMAFVLIVAGCAGTTSTAPGTPSVVPAGCEKALVYKIPGFMPNGPMVCRVAVSTGLAVASTAGHPEFKLLVAVIMPPLYRATLNNNLAGVMDLARIQLKAPKVVAYATPFLVLFDSLNQVGVVTTGGVGLTDCDKNVLASLFKNIGLDAGVDPAAFN
jgi:hypothetical protein